MAGERIASLLAGMTPVTGHKPWPRYELDTEGWREIAMALGAGEGDLLGHWGDNLGDNSGDNGVVHLALRTPALPAPFVVSLRVTDGKFPSVGQFHPAAIRLERTIRDLYGFVPQGMPDERPWFDHGQWGLREPLGARASAELRDPADYAFLPVKGEGLHEIPVGPVHAGIIEPGHFRFTANGETVARLEERLGYTHKGVDALLTNADIEKAGRIVARVSGDSTVAYGFAFARAVEGALGIEVPVRGQVIRGVLAEMERLANHFGDIGAICNDASFPLIHAYCGIFRERILAAADAVFAHRLMMDEIIPGGVAQDISAAGVTAILEALEAVEKPFADVAAVYDDTPSLQDRTCTTGIVRADLVARWAAGGHVGRASARNFDTRRDLAYGPYDAVTLAVPVFTQGDVDARVRVRIREAEESLRLLRYWLGALPPGAVLADMPKVGEPREGIGMVEAFRGDVLVWLRLDAEGRVARAHVRDASWFQWPLLEAAIENNIVADFPLCNKSFNCSYSGHDL